MSQIDTLKTNYELVVKAPWQTNLAGAQRVWFAVYPPAEERRLQARLREFEICTHDAKKTWKQIDISNLPAKFLGEHEYNEGYFQDPAALVHITEDLEAYVTAEVRKHLRPADAATVLAITGVGALFGFLHVSSVISKLESEILGRLLVFFPGEYERNTYRFMDARHGFNYMAIPITCAEGLRI